MVEVERLGGIAGIGGPHSNLRSIGRIALSKLRPRDVEEILAAFETRSASKLGADRFVYRITLSVNDVVRSVDLPEEDTPEAIRNSVGLELQ